MKKVAIVLSGCGVKDGSEIHESVLVLLALIRCGAEVYFFAPDITGVPVVNHLTGQKVLGETRRPLEEAARIARGKIKPLSEANLGELDAVVFPGGFGAATVLCDFAQKGENMHLHPEVQIFAKKMAAAKIPAGFICIAPVMIPRIYPKGVRLTIGRDSDTAAKIEAMGGVHQNCDVSDCVVDEVYRVVSTPAYMLAEDILEASTGIDRLVEELIHLIEMH